MRREHLVALMGLGWSHSARASNEDVAIERASSDLKCDELQMMHSKDEYAFVGCAGCACLAIASKGNVAVFPDPPEAARGVCTDGP